MLRLALAWSLFVAVATAGCTGGVGGALSFNSATLDDPSFDLSPLTGDGKTVFKANARGLGTRYNVTWDWGDGTRSFGEDAEHQYGFTNGIVTVTLIATDEGGQQGIATLQLTLGTGVNKPPTVTARATKAWIEVGETTNLTATGRDVDLDPLTYSWSHRAEGAVAETAIPGEGSRVPVAFDAPGKYAVKVRARDPKGGESVAEFAVDVSTTIPARQLEQTFNGTILAGAGGAGASEKAWLAGQAVPDSNVDATRHRYTLAYPAYTLVFLAWNDTSGQNAADLDLELRSADGTTVFKSETRSGTPAYEFNMTQQEPGEYDIIVRGVVAADVAYTVLLQATLQITPELVAASEG